MRNNTQVVCACVYVQPKIEAIRERMTERGVRLQELKEQMNGVEDEVFRKFCREIGVANIRSVCQSHPWCFLMKCDVKEYSSEYSDSAFKVEDTIVSRR